MTIKRIKNNRVLNISTVSRTSNVSTVTTDVAHGFTTLDILSVVATASASGYDATRVTILSVPSTTQITYTNNGADDSEHAETGTAGINKTWAGQVIFPNEYYDIEETEESDFATNSILQTAIGNAHAIVNKGSDGVDDITDVNDAGDWLRGNLPTPVNAEVYQSKKYQLDLISGNQSLPKTTWTTVYSYSGSGYLWHIWIDLNSDAIDMTIIIDDTYVTIPEINLAILNSFGSSGEAAMLPLTRIGVSNFAFTPQQKIRFDSKIEIKLKTTDSGPNLKDLTQGYVSIVKET